MLNEFLCVHLSEWCDVEGIEILEEKGRVRKEMRKMNCGRRRGGRVETTERGGRGEGNAHIISMLKAYLQTLVRRGGRGREERKEGE